MKKGILSVVALAALVLTSCNGDKTRSVSEIKDATPGDSLMFYWGQSLASDYWENTNSDTAMISEKAREEYLRGIKAGMDAAREDEAYNQGVYVGVQIAMNIKDFKDNYPDLKISDKVLLASLKGGLESKEGLDASQVKADFFKLLNRLATEKREADKVSAYKLLKTKAKELGMTEIAQNLYGKEIAPGSGSTLQDGDLVGVDISVTTLGGEMIGMQMPSEMVVGRNYSSPIVSEALRTMKPGETKQFLTSPIDLAPRRYSQGEFKADTLMKFTIKVMNATPEKLPEEEGKGTYVPAGSLKK